MSPRLARLFAAFRKNAKAAFARAKRKPPRDAAAVDTAKAALAEELCTLLERAAGRTRGALDRARVRNEVYLRLVEAGLLARSRDELAELLADYPLPPPFDAALRATGDLARELGRFRKRIAGAREALQPIAERTPAEMFSDRESAWVATLCHLWERGVDIDVARFPANVIDELGRLEEAVAQAERALAAFGEVAVEADGTVRLRSPAPRGRPRPEGVELFAAALAQLWAELGTGRKGVWKDAETGEWRGALLEVAALVAERYFPRGARPSRPVLAKALAAAQREHP